MAPGRNSLRRMTHHRNNDRPPALRGSGNLTGSRNSFTAGDSNVTGTARGWTRRPLTGRVRVGTGRETHGAS